MKKRLLLYYSADISVIEIPFIISNAVNVLDIVLHVAYVHGLGPQRQELFPLTSRVFP